jgi:hypothetical protein
MATVADKLAVLLGLLPLTLSTRELNCLSIKELRNTKENIDLMKTLIEARLFHDSKLHGIEFTYTINEHKFDDDEQIRIDFMPKLGHIVVEFNNSNICSKLTHVRGLYSKNRDEGKRTIEIEELFHAVRTDLEVFYEQMRDRIGILSQPVKDIT